MGQNWHNSVVFTRPLEKRVFPFDLFEKLSGSMEPLEPPLTEPLDAYSKSLGSPLRGDASPSGGAKEILVCQDPKKISRWGR